MKTDDTSLLIIQDAMALFANAELFSEKLEQLSGVDACGRRRSCIARLRMCDYQVIMTSGFQMAGIDVPLSVAWVVEEDLRTQKQDQFPKTGSILGGCFTAVLATTTNGRGDA